MPNGDWTPPRPIQPAPLCSYGREIGLPDHANGPCDYDPDEVQARINAAVAAERTQWIKAAEAALEILDELPLWWNTGFACGLLRNQMQRVKEGPNVI